MPEVITVQEFICETQEDHSSPTTSSFTTKMANCRNTVTALEEALDKDRFVLQKMKKAVKTRYTTGQVLMKDNVQVQKQLHLYSLLPSLSY